MMALIGRNRFNFDVVSASAGAASGSYQAQPGSELWNSKSIYIMDSLYDNFDDGFFGGTSGDYLSYTFIMPSSWDEGSAIYPYIRWYPQHSLGSTKPGIKWELIYGIRSTDGLTNSNTDNIVDAIGSTNTFIKETQFTAIDMSGYKIGTNLYFRLYRDYNDANDIYTGNVYHVDFGIKYKLDGDGSSTAGVK